MTNLNDNPGRFTKFAHYDLLLMAVGAAAYLVATTLEKIFPDAMAAQIAAIAAIGVVALSALAAFRHNRRPCPICITDLPLDAQTQAETKRRSLKLHHLTTTHVFHLAELAFMVAVWTATGWVAGIAMAVVLLMATVQAAAGWRHRPLQLVCPWCNWRGWDDDDEPERTPAPDPVGAETA